MRSRNSLTDFCVGRLIWVDAFN